MIDLRLGDCLDILPTLPSESVDAVITDPPYPCIKRDYGMMTEAEWWDMMMVVCKETRRILKPTGSAVFILQPNSRHVGQMRGWLWEFMAWVCREWNMVQDAYWWNTSAQPTAHTQRGNGLMRMSVKTCVWVGNDDCHRNQTSILWDESLDNAKKRLQARAERVYTPSGHSMDVYACSNTAIERGGVTPYNILPIPNSVSSGIGYADGHGAGTPLKLADWWTRYICPPGGVVADWFMGSATMGLAALQNGCSFVGIEKMPKYYEIAKRRIEAAQPVAIELPLMAEAC